MKNKAFSIQIYTLFYSCARFSFIFRCVIVCCGTKCDRRYFLLDQVCPLNFVKQINQRLCLLLWIVTPVKKMLELHISTEKFVIRHKRIEKNSKIEKNLHTRKVSVAETRIVREQRKQLFLCLYHKGRTQLVIKVYPCDVKTSSKPANKKI